MKLKYLSVLFSILGVLFLYFISTLSQPVFISLAEIPEYEDKQVIVEGIVTDYQDTAYGSQFIFIEDDNTSVSVFVEGSIDVDYGDTIQATGKVQKYNDDWEVVVNNERYVKIVQKWQNLSIPLVQLAKNPTKYVELNINATGHVDMIYDSYFYLVDDAGEHSLFISCNPSLYDAVAPGEQVTVAGRFDYKKEELRYILTICKETHGVFSFTG
jgi:hypothetical protein